MILRFGDEEVDLLERGLYLGTVPLFSKELEELFVKILFIFGHSFLSVFVNNDLPFEFLLEFKVVFAPVCLAFLFLYQLFEQSQRIGLASLDEGGK